MTGGDVAVVLLAVAALVLVAATVALWFQVRAAAAELAAATHEVHEALAELATAVEDARAAARVAQAESERIEDLLARGDGVLDRVDAASELAYETFSRPVIKAMAVGAGTRQAVRRLRDRDGAP